jgi:hypothetical protein
MFAANLLKDRHNSAGTGEGTKFSSITEDLFKSFGFAANPLDNPVRITTDKVLLRGECTNLSKTIFQIISTFCSNLVAFLFSVTKLLNIFLHP